MAVNCERVELIRSGLSWAERRGLSQTLSLAELSKAELSWAELTWARLA